MAGKRRVVEENLKNFTAMKFVNISLWPASLGHVGSLIYIK